MKKNTKQGHLFFGFSPLDKHITVQDICGLFNGKLTKENKHIESYTAECSEDNGERLVELARQKGVFWWVQPIRDHKRE